MKSFYGKIKKIIHEGGWSLLFKRIRSKFRLSYIAYTPLAHMMPKGLPATQMELKMFTSSEHDVAIASRLLAAFKKATADEPKYRIKKSGADTWDYVNNVYHAEFSAVLSKNDPHTLAAYLSNMHANGSTQGISGSSIEYNDLSSSGRLRNEKGAIVKDILVSFAEALGILPFETDVPYITKKNIYADPDYLVDEIEKRIGISIAPPDIDGGLFKLKLKKGRFDMRDFWALYPAWRMSELISQKNASVCEIGAGLGKSALYAHRFGLHDYSIFDLPMVNAVQAWHLMKALPEKKVVLFGEKDADTDAIKILPYWEFIKTKNSYEVILNEDSFPEMDRDIVDAYLRKTKECSKYLLSINQEFEAPAFAGAHQHHQFVSQRIETVGGFKRIYRFPFWLRKGYVEELYAVQK